MSYEREDWPPESEDQVVPKIILEVPPEWQNCGSHKMSRRLPDGRWEVTYFKNGKPAYVEVRDTDDLP